MIKFITIPFYSFGLMMLYAGLMGKDNLVKYAVGQEKILVEEYLIICAIALVITTIRTVYVRRTKRDTD